MMDLSEVKYVGGELVPRSYLRVVTASRRTTSNEISFNIGTWNERTLRQAGRLENLTSEMDNCKLNGVGLSEVR